MLVGSLYGPTLLCESMARTLKWYLFPTENCLRVQAMGRGRAFTSPTRFQEDASGILLGSS